MKSVSIFRLIEQIAGTPGKNDKIAILSEAISSPIGEELKKVLDYTYNPFKTYGVKKLPTAGHTGEQGFTSETYSLLDNLALRHLSGNGAHEAIQFELEAMDAESAELLRRIIRKDLKAGFGESTINKVSKGLIPSFPYMRCSLPSHTDLNQWDWVNGIFSQEKADGMFVNTNIDSAGSASMSSRQGTPLPYEGFEELLTECERLFYRDSQTHGELLVIDEAGKVLAREIGNGILNSVIQGGDWPEGHKPILKVWDQIPLKCVVKKGKYDVPYDKRLSALYTHLKNGASKTVSLIETRVVKSLKDAYAHYKELLLQGKEGTIIKRRQMILKDHTSKDQVKLKLEAECELEVIDFVPGDETGMHKNTFGSLRCASSCRQLVVDVSGFTLEKRMEIHLKRETYPGTIITVRSNSILYSSSEKKPHSLFLPRFVEERLDKTVADDLARIEEQFENAINLVGIE